MRKTSTRYFAWTGIAVAAGGTLTLLINAGLTPFLQPDAPYPETAASSVFLWRQSLSALAALLLLVGSIGLYLFQADSAGRFGALAFGLAFVGSALLLANEWGQVFFVRELALKNPDVLQAFEDAQGPSLFDIGALIAITAFTLGWLAFSISILLARVYSRLGPILVIAGFFATPILGAALPGVVGLIVGNAVLGGGWMVLGRELHLLIGLGVDRPTHRSEAPTP